MVNELKLTLDAIDEAVFESAKSSYMKAAKLQQQGMWDKGRAILEQYPEVRDGGKGGRPKLDEPGGGSIQLITYRFVAEETGRQHQDIKKWVVLARKYPTKVAAQEWIEEKAEKQTEKYITSTSGNVHFFSASAEWSTPPSIIEAVQEVLGTIDLDPCSDEAKTVPATKRFKEKDDGLAKEWAGKVYMNPPYGDVIDAWVSKLIASHESGEVSEAIALVPARTDTAWFRKFDRYSVCFIDGRLKFGGQENSAPFPSAVFYLGNNLAKFRSAFRNGSIRPPALERIE